MKGKFRRKRRNIGRSKKEKLDSVPSMNSSIASQNVDDGDGGNLDRIALIVNDLIMWTDMAKSTLWFGFGFLFSCVLALPKGSISSVYPWGIFTATSQLGLLSLGASFISNSKLNCG